MKKKTDYEFWLTYASDKLVKIKRVIKNNVIISLVQMVINLLILIITILILLQL